MSIETLAAKKTIQFSYTFVKVLAFIALLVAVCSLAWCTADNIATLRTENAGLKEYRASNERSKELARTSTQAHAVAKADETAQDTRQTEVVFVHDRATKEAANEDPRSADFLSSRIPDRLRRADREARQARSRD